MSNHPILKETGKILLGAAIALMLGGAGIFFVNPFVMADEHAIQHSTDQAALISKLDSILTKIENGGKQREYDLEVDGLRDQMNDIDDEVEKLTVEIEEAPNSTLLKARERRKRGLITKRAQLDSDLTVLINRGPRMENDNG